jgi:Putative Ig domain
MKVVAFFRFTLGYLSLAALLMLSAMDISAQQAPLAITSATSYRSLAGQPIQMQLTAAGGTAPYTWRLLQNKLPRGLQFDPKLGLFSGTVTAPGEYRIPVVVADSSKPPREQQGTIVLIIVPALEVHWKQPAEARAEGIDGSVVVTNNTGRTLNLTVIVVAVNQINKAFALGYQHFDCKPNSDTPVIPFGSTLPFGSYIVHVDAIAEDAKLNHIFRSRLQTPQRFTLQQQP